MKVYREYPAYYEDNDNGFLLIFLILGLIVLFFVINGIAFSIFDFTINGGVTEVDANIFFNYSDVNGNNNGIYLENLNAMDDEIAKKMIYKNSYFDFIVSGDAKNYDMKYTILIKKDDISTLDDKYVKVYLTKLSGSLENEISNTVDVYANLEDIEVDGVIYKKLYTVNFKDTTRFENDYRLRLWVSNDAKDFYGKIYSLKVSIIAESVGD